MERVLVLISASTPHVNLVCDEAFFFFFQAEDGIRDIGVTGVQTCALPISPSAPEESVAIPNRRTDPQDVFDVKTDVYLNWLTGFRNWTAGLVTWLTTFLTDRKSVV